MKPTELKDFLQEKGAGRSGAAPRVYLAAFGKHPGWNDHIDDLGFETQTLVTAKRFIYLDGISSQIDQGAWDRLDAANRHAVFDHSFLWHRGEESLLGLMCDSRDGKGRSRYPMVLCLHAIGLSVTRVVVDLGPILEAAMNDCLAVATAAEVEAILDRARATLRERAAVPPPVETGSPLLLPGHPGLGPDNEGLFRILYQVRNQFGAWAPGRIDYSDAEALPRAAHLRAPQLFPALAEGAPVWLDFFRSQVDRDAPVLLLWPRTAPWVDVIVGPPDGADLFALRANTKAVPLAPEVPYQIDPAFRAEAEALFGEFGRGSDAAHNIFAADPGAARKTKFLPQLRPARVAKSVRGTGRSFGDWLKAKPKKLVWTVVGVGAGLIVGIAALVYWGTRPASERPAGTPPPAPAGGTAQLDEAIVTAWRALCTAQYDWVGNLQGELQKPDRKARWRSDPDLRTRVIERLDNANAALEGLSPQKLAKTSGSGQSLAANLPPALTDPAVRKKITDAAAVTADVGQALIGWPMLVRLADTEKIFATQGWRGAAAELGKLRGSVKLDSALAGAVDDLLARRVELRSLAEHTETATTGWAALEGTHDPFLTAWAAQAADEARAAKTLPELNEVFVRWTHGIAEARALLAPGSGLDSAQLAQAAPVVFDPKGDAAAQLDAWLARARGYVVLPEAERPLTAAGQAELTALRDQTRQLRRLAPGELAAGFDRRLDELAGHFDALVKQPALRRDAAQLGRQAAQFEDARKQLGTELAAEIGRRANPAAWLAEVRGLTLEGTAVVAREWAARRDALLTGFDASQANHDIDKFLFMQKLTGKLEAFMRAASRELSVVMPADPGQNEELLKDLGKVMQKHREDTLADLLGRVTWKEQVPAQTWAEFILRPEIKEVLDGYNRTYLEVSVFGTRLAQTMHRLDEGFDWAQLTADEKDVLVAEPELAGLPSVAEFARRLDGLRQVSLQTTRPALRAAAAGLDLNTRLAAWRALGRLPDWPAAGAELAEDEGIRAGLREAIERQFAASPRRAPLLAELTAEGARRWKNYLPHAKTAEELTGAFDRMKASGVEVAELGPRDRYNEWLFRVKRTGWRDLKGDELAQRRKYFLDELDRSPGGKDIALTETWLADLAKVSTADPKVDNNQVGPGGAGWKLMAAGDPAVLSYRWEKAGQITQLDFHQIEPVAGKPVYLCTTEFPVKLLIDWSEQRKLWPELLHSLDDMIQEIIGEGKDNRRGPCTFVFRAIDKKLALAPGWIERSAAADYYPEGHVPPPPNERTPANYLTPAAAQLLAQSLNCRLPTVGEWQAADRMTKTKGTGAATQPNRRDTTWALQFDRILQLPAGRDKRLPNEEAFVPPTYMGSKFLQKPAVGYDDGVLWFRSVDEGESGPFLNLVGNVAEFVTAEPGAKVSVIGGSALSGSEVEVDKPYPAESKVYSDVGFRLAFALEQQMPGQIVAALVDKAPYH